MIKLRKISSRSKHPEVRYYLSSMEPEKRTPGQWLQLIRGHWGGIENRNHWRKDACLFEDLTRSRDPNLVATFALLRNILLLFFEKQRTSATLNGFVEALAADSSKAFLLIRTAF